MEVEVSRQALADMVVAWLENIGVASEGERCRVEFVWEEGEELFVRVTSGDEMPLPDNVVRLSDYR